MNKDELKQRTKAFAVRVMKLVDHLPRSNRGRVLGDQLLRSGTSVAANYRAACRARSTAEFISKLGNVLEESDESALCMELIIEDEMLPAKRVESLLTEANELTAIFSPRAAPRSARILNPKSLNAKFTHRSGAEPELAGDPREDASRGVLHDRQRRCDRAQRAGR